MTAALGEFAMHCLACGKQWLRFGTTSTLCPFCGSIDTVARRVVRVPPADADERRAA